MKNILTTMLLTMVSRKVSQWGTACYDFVGVAYTLHQIHPIGCKMGAGHVS